MDAHDRECFQRIAAFEIDEPGTIFTFAARLARDNGWSIDYVRRVIDEYKKFAFLAVAADHPVTPSEQVDQAWHLHLTYTRSYWERFCPEALGKPLHHHPTKGGGEEQGKFLVWYNRTLESYRWFFHQQPPSDIWPDGKSRFGETVAYCRVNRRRNWIIPKPRFKFLSTATVLVFIGIALGSGCLARGDTGLPLSSPPLTLAGLPNPFSLDGPRFLWFFGVVLAVASLLAVSVRNLMRRSSDHGLLNQGSLDPYQVAYLAGGRKAAINAAIASLVSQGALAVDAVRHRFTRQGSASNAVHPVEQAVLRAADSEFGTDLNELHRDFGPLDAVADELRSRGLIVSHERNLQGRVLPVLVLLAVAAFGTTRIFQGVSREKPVGFLVAATIATVVFALVAFGRRLHRTHRGDRVLAELRLAKTLLQSIGGQVRPDLAGPDLALALGLFGVGILATGPLANLHAALKPPKNCGSYGDGSSFWGCGSVCGGGGGGCGGGGCGGCGGCGG